MWIVRIALSRPYTFIVMTLVILLLTPGVVLRTPTDIFPDINIPVISLVWNYTGLAPQEMEQRITGNPSGPLLRWSINLLSLLFWPRLHPVTSCHYNRFQIASRIDRTM